MVSGLLPWIDQAINRIFISMNDPVSFFQSLYGYFNAREIESVLAHLTENVKWANGMDGGFIYGREGVQAYWNRQFKAISSRVYPLDIQVKEENIVIRVHQVVHDLEGKLISDQVVQHIFYMDGDKISEFKIAQ